MEIHDQPDAENRSGEPSHTASVIRTPDQRVRVFVSSTLDELAPERATAREAITQLHLTPVLFESGARPYPPRELYRAYLAQSDIFIGMYWQHYGWVAPTMQVSGLEDEYQLSENKPRLIYIKVPAPEREQRLQLLLDRIRSEDAASYQKFTTAEQLREHIANDLAVLLTEHFTEPDETPFSPARRLSPLSGNQFIDHAQDRAQALSRQPPSEPVVSGSLSAPSHLVSLFCRWLWKQQRFIWGTVLLGLALNMGATLLTTTVNLARTPLGWLIEHPWLLSMGVFLLLLQTVLAWAGRREPDSAADLPHHKATLESQNRLRFLQRLQKYYRDELSSSLQSMTPLTLRLREDSSLVHTQRLRSWRPEHADRPLAEDISILDVFDQAGQSLLILGAPGSGKTTLLYELALSLLERARQDTTQPLPIVLSLSSWTKRNRSFRQWLAEEVEIRYLLPRHLAAQWIQEKQVLLLLDGLDELPVAARTACIDELNAYHVKQVAPLVVCSREQEYRAQTEQLTLQNAVMLQPLSHEQVRTYLKSAGRSLAAVRRVVSSNQVLRELLTTPLFLSDVTLAYRDRSMKDIPHAGSQQEQQREIFGNYVTRMLEQKGGKHSYPPHLMLRWLSWLAQQLQQRYQTEFYLERLQPDWLPPSRWYPFLLCTSVAVLYGLLLGLCAVLWNGINPTTGSIDLPESIRNFFLFGLVIACLYIGLNTLAFQWLRTPKALSPPREGDSERQRGSSILTRVRTNRFVFGFILGLLYGLWLFAYDMLLVGPVLPLALLDVFTWTPLAIMIAIIIGPFDPKIRLMEVMTWSWTHIRKGIGLALIACIMSGLFDGLLIVVLLPFSPSQQVTVTGLFGLASFFGITLLASLNMVIGSAISYGAIEERQRITPNEGIKRAKHRSFQMGLLWGGVFGLSAVLLQELAKMLLLHRHLIFFGGVRNALFFGLLAAITIWTYNGGLSWYKHMVLRFLLWRRGAIPWHYERMLDEAAQRILLYKVGGGYRFIHDLFRDYLASRETDGTSIHG